MLHFGNTLVDIWKFISTHWRLILEGGLVVLLFILQLFKKRPVKVLNTIEYGLQKWCVYLIQSAERLYTHGDLLGKDKKQWVLDRCKEWLSQYYPEADFSAYSSNLSDFIEEVLSTPQKKGE